MAAQIAGSHETRMTELVDQVQEPDGSWAEKAWARLDSLTKPPRSLGRLEQLAVRLAAVQRTTRPEASPSAIVLMAGDHGVVAEGVSAWPSEVTLLMMSNFAAEGAAINQLASINGARLVLVDVGVAGDTSELLGVVQAKVRPGTGNIAKEPAMTREEAAQAFMLGADMARALADEGVKVIGTGEMGIGNTTASAALIAAYTGVPVARIVGRGTGIDDAMLAHKRTVVDAAIRLHHPDAHDPLRTLSELGGLEIAAMAGLFVGGAAAGVSVVSDGVISAAAALAAFRLCPACIEYIFPSHTSQEIGHRVALVALGLEPFIDLEMRLGEGTGAAIGINVLASACAMMNGMATFAEAGIAEREDA